MKTAQQLLAEALDGGYMDEGVKPQVLYRNLDVDFKNVAELKQAYVNGCWDEQMKVWLENGFVLFLLQTELHSSGHCMCAYFAKMKSN